MDLLLAAILVIAILSLGLNGLYIAHELGWFPHGKRRDVPIVRREMADRGPNVLTPTLDEFRANDRDSQTTNIFAHNLRRYAHKAVYAYEPTNAEAHLRTIIETYVSAPTASHRDDLLNLMNDITCRQELTESLDEIVEEVIRITSEPSRGDDDGGNQSLPA